MKYKLIKEYPGSEKLGYEVSSDCGTLEWKGTNFYEKYPEYWKKVNEHLWWVVFTKEEALFKTYTPYLIETYAYHVNDSREYFKTKEEAEEFILENCPSFKEAVSKLSKSIDRLNDSVKELSNERINISKAIKSLNIKL